MIEELLIKLVRDTIEDRLDHKTDKNKENLKEKFPSFNEKRATFVTLTLYGNLRGCIGSLIPHVSLYEDLTSNALKAAFEDPRFSPLSKDEFKNVKVEISLISPISSLSYEDFDDLKKKLIPNQHGVILKFGTKQATFLPQVWEQLPEFDQFMSHLFHKAGIDPSSLTHKPEIFVYTVDKIKE